VSRISYEIVPGSIFPKPPAMANASYALKAKAQKLAEKLFEGELAERLGLAPAALAASQVVAGGWRGRVNPSAQVRLGTRVSARTMRAYAAALGLIWRQDAVAVSKLNPRGRRLAVVLRRADRRRFTAAQAQRLYERLYQHDSAKQATVGFMELDGALVFINAGTLSDDEFQQTIMNLAERQLSGEVLLDLARADFELEWTDWSKDNGERYRTRLRETGRSDLLHWIETHARPEAQRFVEEFDWEGRKGKRKRPP
jgi:hypothetical protein